MNDSNNSPKSFKDIIEAFVPLAVSGIIIKIGFLIRNLGYHYVPPGAGARYGVVSYDGFAGFFGVILIYVGIFSAIISVIYFFLSISDKV